MRPESVTEVTIQLFRGESLAETLVDSTENSGSFMWTVPTSLQEGEDYRVKVFCADEPSVEGDSENFMITYSYVFIKKWGSQGSGDGQFDFYYGVDGIDVAGYVYVADEMNARIQKFTHDGGFVLNWATLNHFYLPSDVALDSAGNVYVTSMDRICVYSSSEEFQSEWSINIQGDSQNGGAGSVAIDRDGFVYVSDFLNNKIKKFTADGTFVKAWGSVGSGNGQFDFPGSLAVDDSFVYVTDFKNNRIQKFTYDGVFVLSWENLDNDGSFQGIAVGPQGYIYVSDSNMNTFYKFTPDGKFITQWKSEPASGEGELNEPYGIAVDEAGNVYVVDIGNYCIQKFGPNTSVSLTKK